MNQQGGFDLSGVLQQAAQVTTEAQDRDGNMKVLYPQPGELKCRIIFNAATGLAMRKFERHTIGNTKVPCLTQYGRDCPVCKILDNIQNAKGVDLWKLKRTTRGIAYAEYIESTYKWDNPADEPQRGEIVILMFPWSVYTDLNRLITSAGDQVYTLIAQNVGKIFKITRWTENNQVKYKTEVDAFAQDHQTRPTDEEYNKLITDLPSLNDKFVPIELSDKLVILANTTADELNREYLSPQVQQPNKGVAGTNLGGFVPPPTTPNTYVDPNTMITYDLSNNQWIPRQQPQQMAPPPPVPQYMPPAPPQVQYAPGVAPPAQTQTAIPQGQIPPWETAQSAIQAPGTFQQPQMAPPVAAAPPPQPQVTAPQAAAQAPGAANPPCFGRKGFPDINPNQCLLCPAEATCGVSG